MSPRHLEPVPDPPATSTSGISGEWLAELLDWRPHTRPTLTIIGEVATDPPGWWVCPDCGRRRDRAGEPRTVTAVLCTGPDRPFSPRHEPTEMRVQR